jgi:phospholipid/cholesterol/gamma-HCH transport system substrate-binding protein
MKSSQSSFKTRFKVGVFSLVGLALVGAVTVFVNDRPYWWRPCQLVHINIEDASGLKTKSPVKSLGIQIGFLKSVELSETQVRLGICITAPVEVLESTRAYIRGEGFLGDKFVELKPVRYTGKDARRAPSSVKSPTIEAAPQSDSSPTSSLPTSSLPTSSLRSRFTGTLSRIWNRIGIASVHAQEPSESPAANSADRNIPVGKQGQDFQKVVDQVDGLVSELTELTTNLKTALDPKDLKNTMFQLNKTLENASRTLSPEGGLNTTAQRTLAKLEEAIENLRDMMTRVNRGEGSLGMIINDPTYAEELREVIRNANRLLGRVSQIRMVITVGGEKISGLTGGRGSFLISIYPQPDRYYLLGVSVDPRGKRTVKNYTTVSGGVTTNSQVTETEDGGLLINAMLGKIFVRRIEVAIGLLHGDGTISFAGHIGPGGREEMAILRADGYSQGKGYGVDARLSLVARPLIRHSLFGNVYLRGGVESLYRISNQVAWSGGAGVTFDDQDIKLLFTFL